MNTYRIKQLSLKWGLISTLIALISFVLNWYVLKGELVGYRILLFPGNTFLSMFTEEIDFNLKLVLLLLGQFTMTALFTILVVILKQKFNSHFSRNR